MSTIATAPPRMYIMNLENQDQLEAQFNPLQWEAQIGVTYADLTIVGNTYQPRHFITTVNDKVTFDLLFTAGTKTEKGYLSFAQRFVMSVCRKWRGKLAPPNVLFSWPGEASIVCKVDSAKIGHKRFNQQAGTVELEIKVDLTEVRDAQLYGDDVMVYGWNRGSSVSKGGF